MSLFRISLTIFLSSNLPPINVLIIIGRRILEMKMTSVRDSKARVKVEEEER